MPQAAAGAERVVCLIKTEKLAFRRWYEKLNFARCDLNVGNKRAVQDPLGTKSRQLAPVHIAMQCFYLLWNSVNFMFYNPITSDANRRAER